MQFDRIINAQIRLIAPKGQNYRGTITVENLRMTFSILKTESASTNTCNFKVYNLSSDKRNELANFGDEVRVSAGYKNSNGAQFLFLGDTTQVSHLFSESEIITSLDCGDGDKTLNNTTISISFAEEITAKSVIKSIAEKMNLNLIEFSPKQDLSYRFGYANAGKAIDILKQVCNYLNLIPSVQNGDLYILDRSVGTVKLPIDINADTGMIGTPERFTDKSQFAYRPLAPNAKPEPGWKVRTLLRPDILPGDKIRLRSQRANVNGVFYVISARHEGDNYGPQFESTLEVISI